MHLITNSTAVNLGGGLDDLKPGTWLVNDANAFEIAMRADKGKIQVSNSGWEKYLNPNPQAGTLILRSGAIGDLLMLSPALRALGHRTGPLAVSCFPHHHGLFDHIVPALCSMETYPLPVERLRDYHEVITLENTMEADATQHPTTIFAKALGLETPLSDNKPLYQVTAEERERTSKWLFGSRPNVAIQPRASVPNRDYPAQLWGEVFQRLEKDGWGVLILGRKGQLPPIPPHLQSPYVRDLSREDLPLRDSVAVLSQCQAFCGVDSSFMHFAGALDIPAVSLHGPFKWETRTNFYPKNTALSGVGACAGCSWHMHAGHLFPPNKPCSETGVCVVLANIAPARIVARLNLLKP